MSNVSNNLGETDSVETSPVSARELISICRQIGGMMEAGVDILRVTRVLRAQTKNPRLLEWYDQFDHELTMGRGLPEALAQAPDLFSPFAVSLVRQGEERNDLSGAFLRVADFLAKEVESDARDATTNTSHNAPQVLAGQNLSSPTIAQLLNTARTTNLVPENIPAQSAQWWWRRANLLGAGVLGAIAISDALVAAGWVDARWGRVARSALSASVLGALAASKSAPPALPAAISVAPPVPQFDVAPTDTAPLAAKDESWSEAEFASAELPVTPFAEPSRAPTQRAPSWDAEVDTTRRIDKPPRDEENFD